MTTRMPPKAASDADLERLRAVLRRELNAMHVADGDKCRVRDYVRGVLQDWMLDWPRRKKA